MATTPVYSWPYQVRTDAPDGATLGEALSLAIESEVSRMDTAPDVQVFTANGTWTKPANAKWCRIRVQAGGGAGGGAASTAGGQMSCGGGGQGGGFAESILAASTLGATETVTRGAGGTGVSGAAGNNGADSSFGAHVIAIAGAGGNSDAAGTTMNFTSGGFQVQAGTGQIVLKGQGGSVGARSGGTDSMGGQGGASHMGGGAHGESGSHTGTLGGNFGGGGSGASNGPSQSARLGGAGGPGLIVVETFF